MPLFHWEFRIRRRLGEPNARRHHIRLSAQHVCADRARTDPKVAVRGTQAPRQRRPPPSSALANLGRDTDPAVPGMERNMTKEIVEFGGAPDRDVTLIELQRWEDDGGAALPDVTPRKKRSLQAHSPGTGRCRWHAQD